jgi:hypothetical protein
VGFASGREGLSTHPTPLENHQAQIILYEFCLYKPLTLTTVLDYYEKSIPAKAGIQLPFSWIPIFIGMVIIFSFFMVTLVSGMDDCFGGISEASQ